MTDTEKILQDIKRLPREQQIIKIQQKLDELHSGPKSTYAGLLIESLDCVLFLLKLDDTLDPINEPNFYNYENPGSIKPDYFWALARLVHEIKQ